ncbi:MAG TPA: c-type cytochrome [Candidatus Limnocylindria bacterium]|nr:c-type cytochrome [Candidatus Limnocylindria bacterium]
MIKLLSIASALFCGVILSGVPSWAQNQAEGRKLYASYCSTCHGDKGKGDGMAAKSLPAKPTDHTNGAIMNQMNDKFLLDIISKGGSAVGKSSFMPAWGNALDEKQIRDVMAFIRTLAVPAYKGETPASK